MIFHVLKAKNVLFYSKVFFSSKSRFSLKSYFLCDFFRSFSLSINNWMVISQSLSSVFLFLFANDHKRLEESKKKKEKERKKERKKEKTNVDQTDAFHHWPFWLNHQRRTNERKWDGSTTYLINGGGNCHDDKTSHTLSLSHTAVCYAIWGQFHQHFTSSFYTRRSQKRKRTVNSSSFLHFWDLQAYKLPVNTLMKLTPGVDIEKQHNV